MEYSVEMKNIQRVYPGVVANDDVSINIRKGSVMCLVGENGAGKSTLMKILYGLEKPDGGTIYLNGGQVVFHSSRDAIKHRIGMVHQHFMLVDELSVLENIILGMEPMSGIRLDYKKAKIELAELSKKFNMPIPLDAIAGTLPVGVQQKVEILKAMYRGADVLILDEPTAVLTPQETGMLFETVRRLAENGYSVILITHKLDEVIQVADDIVVMRMGKVVGKFTAAQTNPRELAEKMVGSKLPETIARQPSSDKVILSAKDVSVCALKGKPLINRMSLELNEGEILGIAGVSGNGQRELANLLAGLVAVDEGTLTFMGNDITATKRSKRLELGISYIPEDRWDTGLCLPWSVADNMIAGFHRRGDVLKKGFLNFSAIRQRAEKLIKQFDVRTSGENTPVQVLSGGNQQKVVIARESMNGAKFLIAAEPTRGVDIGAISFIHNDLMNLRNSGIAILLISSDLDEIFKLSDRIAVLYEGEIVFSSSAGDVSREELGLYMAGSKKEAKKSGR